MVLGQDYKHVLLFISHEEQRLLATNRYPGNLLQQKKIALVVHLPFN